MLVGTVSIEKSEGIAQPVPRQGRRQRTPSSNARMHEQEARIVAQAGRLGAVTIATNMAGRGTDIQLGGNVEYRIQDELAKCPKGRSAMKPSPASSEVAEEKRKVIEAGGLFVLGTERHESRRIDNQLRGRSGRQGDPGLSRFYLCLEDDLLRIFGPDTLFSKMMKSNLADGGRSVRNGCRKRSRPRRRRSRRAITTCANRSWQYDDVMNDQRKVVYEQRAEINGFPRPWTNVVVDMRHDTINTIVGTACPPGSYPRTVGTWRASRPRSRISSVCSPRSTNGWPKTKVEPELLEERLRTLTDAMTEEKNGRQCGRLGGSSKRTCCCAKA